MTIRELQKRLQQAVADLDMLLEDTIITDFHWQNPGPLSLLIGHDQDFEAVPGECIWTYQDGLAYPWEASVQVGSIECHNRYEHHPDSETKQCCICYKKVEEWYEGIPKRSLGPGVYCKECWEAHC